MLCLTLQILWDVVGSPHHTCDQGDSYEEFVLHRYSLSWLEEIIAVQARLTCSSLYTPTPPFADHLSPSVKPVPNYKADMG